MVLGWIEKNRDEIATLREEDQNIILKQDHERHNENILEDAKPLYNNLFAVMGLKTSEQI